jgi:hypothetical protein
MVERQSRVRVTMTSGGYYPLSFRWRERHVRVLGVASINTFGTERRFRVLTPVGTFELGWFIDRGLWYVRRAPGFLGRFLARWQNAPRYPLPAWRRRSRRQPMPLTGQGGLHADRVAVV